MSNTWYQHKESGRPCAISLMLFFYRVLGRRFCTLLLAPIALYFYLVKGMQRRASISYLVKVFSAKSITHSRFKLYALSYCLFHEFAYAIFDKFVAWLNIPQKQQFKFNGKESLRALLDSGKGALVISAHLGNIEMLRALATELQSVYVNALMFTEHNLAYAGLLEKHTNKTKLNLVQVKAVDPMLIIDLQQRISTGELVGAMADRITPNAKDKIVRTNFLGYPTNFPVGPFILAHLLCCPVYLVFCFRVKDGYEAFFEPFADHIKLSKDTRALDLEKYTKQYVQRLEYYCKQYPLQWFNFYEFWDGHT